MPKKLMPYLRLSYGFSFILQLNTHVYGPISGSCILCEQRVERAVFEIILEQRVEVQKVGRNVATSQRRDIGSIIVDTDGTFEEGLVRIMDSWDPDLQSKTVRLVKVLWKHQGLDEATWEREDMMCATYHFLFEDEGTWFSRLVIK